ncbi:hypothetical protein QYM36_006673 [Artemia franciscana]|nr:hypothetical protein QYM36_006673 [Artemia franciscana]
MHSSLSEEPSPPDILKQIGCVLLESRMPSKDDSSRGYVEGPHYPDLRPKAFECMIPHRCKPEENKQCHLVREFEEMVKIGRGCATHEFNIHVYLTPSCDHTSLESQKRKVGWMLVESWSLGTSPSQSDKSFTINSLTLLHAIRSFLQFTQLSCWLNRSKGKWSRGIEMIISKEEAHWPSEYAGKLIAHKFVDCRMNDMILSVRANLLPKLDKMPTVTCFACENSMQTRSGLDCNPREPGFMSSVCHVTSLQLDQPKSSSQYFGTPFQFQRFNLNRIQRQEADSHHPVFQSSYDNNVSPVEDGILFEIPNRVDVSEEQKRRRGGSQPIPIPGMQQFHSNIAKLNARNRLDSGIDRPQVLQLQVEKPGLSLEKDRGRERTPRKRQSSERSGNSRDRRRQAENCQTSQGASRKLDLEAENAANVFTILRLRDVQTENEDEPGPSRSRNLHIDSECSAFPNKVKKTIEGDANDEIQERCSPKNTAVNTTKPKMTVKAVPSAQDRAKFHEYLDSSASMVFHTWTPHSGLPLTSSLVPMVREPHFNFDKSLEVITDNRCANESSVPISPVDVNASPVPYEPFRRRRRVIRHAWRPSLASTSLLGTFEESMLNGRLEPTATVEGFRAELGASGAFCPAHKKFPVSVFFYALTNELDGSSPYLGHINLGEKGYQVPKEGTIQLTLFNPQGTVVKMFVILYNLSEMSPNSRTFLRQRTYYMPRSAGEHHQDVSKWLRYLVHLR